MERWRKYSSYLKENYGGPVYRVALDCGFSCPNRDEMGRGGCTFCDAPGAIASYQRKAESAFFRNSLYNERVSSSAYVRDITIEEQAERAISFLKRRYKADKFALYLQAFTNTYAPLGDLEKVYNACFRAVPFALSFIVSTRSDALSDEVIDLLLSYKTEERDVWVELGLQTANDNTLRRVKRGHDTASWVEGARRAKQKGLKVSSHVILGLPGDGRDDYIKTALTVSDAEIDAVKIHNLHIVGGSEISVEYQFGYVTAPSFERHLENTELFLRYLSPDIVIERLTADTPSHRLMAPRSFPDKGVFISALEKKMTDNGTMQGDIWKQKRK